MTNPWIVTAAAIFLWWFSTGVILMRVRRADMGGPDDHLWSVLLGLPLLLGGGLGLDATSDDASAAGAFLAFLSAISVWGWIELSFLSGVITGPNRRVCPPGLPLGPRFLRAAGTVIYHEILLVVALLVIARITLGTANEFGLWTYAVLFVARISAKLNLFLGVPRIHSEFLPRTIAHLDSHFRRAGMNLLFPVSVTVLTLAAGCWMERAIAAPSEGQFVGHVLLTVLTLLALLEHWFMVLPLPDQKLWRWMLPQHPAPLTPQRAKTARPEPDTTPS
jgi:putative photosynthetic complex assembly protein 2